MKTWIAKWNRDDELKPSLEHDWIATLSRRTPFRCYGRADGTGGHSLRPLHPGDLIVCYQTDERAIAGVARVDDVQSNAAEPFVVLRALAWFDGPRQLNELIAEDPALADLSAFRPGNVNTFRPLATDDCRRMLRACGVDDGPIAACLGSSGELVE